MSEPTSERRLNLLTGDHVLVSPQRTQRPWLGAVEAPAVQAGLTHDPDCYLCPGNARAGGHRNPAYDGVYVFGNDFPALSPVAASGAGSGDPYLSEEPEHGICRVICYTPDHSRTMARMSEGEIGAVIEVWARETRDLMTRGDLQSVVVFENRGAMMGASNPHPHGQIWATGHVPNEVACEWTRQREWQSAHGIPLLTGYLARERAAEERIVIDEGTFAALVPWWASWPFEVLVVPERPVGRLDELSEPERRALARLLRRLTAAYDRVFETPFPYSMGFHQAPQGAIDGDFVLHAHFYPPLLRSAAVRKFMVGFEMLAMPQRDLTPEAAAARLRDCVR
jgi:UDPglucose--hexose-1-phosphate uridylyltransferase